jgi:hypothetical protein
MTIYWDYGKEYIKMGMMIILKAPFALPDIFPFTPLQSTSNRPSACN